VLVVVLKKVCNVRVCCVSIGVRVCVRPEPIVLQTWPIINPC